jgi:hypothetical protein
MAGKLLRDEPLTKDRLVSDKPRRKIAMQTGRRQAWTSPPIDRAIYNIGEFGATQRNCRLAVHATIFVEARCGPITQAAQEAKIARAN